MKAFSLILGFCFISAQGLAQSQYETVVEGTRFNSTSKIILNQEAIRKSKAPNISTLIATQTSIPIINTPTSPNSIFFRGGDSGHILISVDGLPFYDPSTLQKTINLNLIDIHKVKKIEILKGSQSVLYGGHALAAVIKIETFPSEIEKSLGVRVEGGQRNYKRASTEFVQPTSESQALVTRLQASGKSNRSPVLGSKFNYKNQSASGDVGYLHRGRADAFIKFSQNWSVEEFAVPSGAAGVADLANNVNITNVRAVMAGVNYKHSPMRPQLWAGYQNSHRNFNQGFLPGDFSDYVSDLTALRLELIPLDLDRTRVVTGASFTAEKFRDIQNNFVQSNAYDQNTGVFAKLTQVISEQLEIEAGVRQDFSDHRDAVLSYQLGFNFFEHYRLEFATGYKAPSLAQRFSTTYGRNPDLKPERAQTYSLNYDRKLSERLNLAMTIFETSFSDLISMVGFPPNSQHVNVRRARTRGVEGHLSFQTANAYKLDLNFTYQEPWDVTAARWLNRRPLTTGSLRSSKSWGDNQIGYELVAVGQRRDGLRTLPGFANSNLFYNRQIRENFTAFVRGQNILDQRFQQIYGYHDEGAFWLAGIDVKL